jgi:hypothetical protein
MTVVQTLMISSLMALGQAVNPPPQVPVQDPMRPMQQGQRGLGPNQPNNRPPGPPIQELQEIFDAFALVQAQKRLQLDDDTYGKFFPRMSRVYQLRRAHGQQRARLINDIRRLYGPGRGTDASLSEAVQRLDDLEEKFRPEMRAARLAVDQVLTPRQRAGLRFFEEEMERQKIDFITQARSGGPGVPPGKLPGGGGGFPGDGGGLQ